MSSNSKLSAKKCIPCNKDVPLLKGHQLLDLHKQLDSGWQIIEEHHLEKEYLFPDFSKALVFTNKIGAIAEQEGHHPNILLSYGKIKIQIWTHKINGLSESDFIIAAKCDEVSRSKDKQEIIKAYFHALEAGTYNEIIQLFTPNAIVHSPLYNKIEAVKFYKELFSDTQSSNPELKDLYLSIRHPNRAICHFNYKWTLRDGSLVEFECVDIFEFESEKIQKLTIIYDTYLMRKEFEKIHKK